jgi:ubiquitin C-terminal hydrolase
MEPFGDKLSEIENVNNQIISTSDFGRTGLINLGNTCFLNASIQVLAHTVKFRNFILSRKYKEMVENIIKNKLITNSASDKVSNIDSNIIESEGLQYVSYCFNILFTNVWKNFVSVRPISLYTVFLKKHPSIGRFSQEDAHECIIALLDDIHIETGNNARVSFPEINDEVKQLINIRNDYVRVLRDETSDEKTIEKHKNNYKRYKKEHIDAKITYESFKYWQQHIQKMKCSKITELFDFLLSKTVRCNECNYISYSFTPDRHLSVPIPNKMALTLEDCLKEYCHSELLSGTEQYKCKKCDKHVNAITDIKFWEIGDILPIQFERFNKKQVGKTIIWDKNSVNIKYPLKLNLYEYLSDIAKRNKKSREDEFNYELYGIICHSGGTNGGHYYALCKNSIDSQWYSYNDSHVNKISLDDVNDANAYILFYNYVGAAGSSI